MSEQLLHQQSPLAANEAWDQLANQEHVATLQQAGVMVVEHSVELSQTHEQTAADRLALPESLPRRIEAAKEQSSFKDSPEVSEAIGMYYQDHYRFGSVVEKIVAGDTEGLDGSSLDGLIDNHLLKNTAAELLQLNADPAKRGEALRKAEEAVYYGPLFKEVAVAAETIDEPEQAYAVALLAGLQEAAIDEGYGHQLVDYRGETIRVWDAEKAGRFLPNQSTHMVDPARIKVDGTFEHSGFWEDTRFAGQLEFHNTGNFADINGQGNVLRSRTQQRALTGDFRSQMGVANNREFGMHSNLVHYSETYSPHEYKVDSHLEDNAKSAAHKEKPQPGTFGVPLAKLVEAAPYARDRQYGVVELKDAANESKITINDDIGDIGSGGTDLPGKSGKDRVFMTDNRAEHAQESVNYDLNLGEESYRLLTTEEMYDTYKDMGFGVGQYLPALRELPYNHKEIYKQIPGESPDEIFARITTYKQELAKTIAGLQAESRNKPEYKGKVVVPLRSNVMEFVAEAQSSRRPYQAVVKHSVA